MLKFIFPIAILCFVVSCTSDEQPIPEQKVEPEVIVDEKPKKEYDPSSVLSRTEEFFDWYLENNRMLYRMRSSCIGAENGYHALDEKKLSEYTTWLSKTGFFSKAFVSTERNRWTTECAEQMREKARKKEHYTGPPPCVFEGDVFFKIQERPTQEMVDELEFSVAEQTDNSALVNFSGSSSLNWSFVNGIWKIDTWPN